MRGGVSSAQQTAVSAAGTAPFYMVQIDMAATTLRFSSRGDVTWNGSIWVEQSLKVNGLGWDGTAMQTGSLDFQNVDNTFVAIVLSEGFADKRVRVWSADASALAAGDPVLIFDGVGDDADGDTKKLTLMLTSSGSRYQYALRSFIAPENGFTALPPDGMIVVWGNETYELRVGD